MVPLNINYHAAMSDLQLKKQRNTLKFIRIVASKEQSVTK